MTAEETSGETKTVFVGPSNEPYFKFKFAQLVFHLFRLSRVARALQYIPGSTHLTLWAFKVTVMSRDFETVSESEDDDDADSRADNTTDEC